MRSLNESERTVTRESTLLLLVGMLALGCSSSSGPADARDGDAGTGDGGDAAEVSPFNAPTCEADQMTVHGYGLEITPLIIADFWTGVVTGGSSPIGARVSTMLNAGPVSVGFAAADGQTLVPGSYVVTGAPKGPELSFELSTTLDCTGQPGEFRIDEIHTHTSDAGATGFVLDSLKARWTQVCTVNGTTRAGAGCINFTGAVRPIVVDAGGDGADAGDAGASDVAQP